MDTARGFLIIQHMSLQLEDGQFTRISNEILEKLLIFKFPPKTSMPLRLTLFVIRKTWGYQKKEDYISLTQFQKGVDSNRPSVVHWLNYLVKANILAKGDIKKYGTLYGFNKYWEQWKWGVIASELVIARKFTSNGAITRASNGAVTHKRNMKETRQKKLGATESQDINNLINYFKETVNPHISFANKTERKACNDLLNAYGLERVKESLAFLEKKRQTDKYLPLITTPYELWTKWAKIKQHLTTNVKRKIWKTTLHSLPSQLEQNTK